MFKYLVPLALVLFVSALPAYGGESWSERRNKPEVLAEMLKEAQTGDSNAEYAYGSNQIGRGFHGDFCDDGAEWLKKAAEQGHARAQADLISYYWYGCASRIRAEDLLHHRDHAVYPYEAYYWFLIYEKTIKVDLSPKLRQTVKTQFSANGELCDGNATQVYAGI